MCLGLDPEVDRLPPALAGKGVDGLIEFNVAIVRATAGLVAAYKPQAAYYEDLGLDGPRALQSTIAAIREHAPGTPVILDAKRGDIGKTNDAYARAIFDFYGADATTLHPYLGAEAATPFIGRADKGVFVLCRTSNPGAGQYQNLSIDGEPLYRHVASDVNKIWNTNGNCGLVVGATAPEELASVVSVSGNMPILVPGIGAQGGDLEATLRAGSSGDSMLLISSSRGLIYAYEKSSDDFDEATRKATIALQAEIDQVRAGL